jgi:hypothetical protein
MNPFTQTPRRRLRGFSLVEVCLGMMLTLGVAATTVGMTSQHIRLMAALNSFTFLRDDAPSINLLLSRILQRADTYRVYPTKSAAFAGSGAVNTGGTALWLRFRNPDGTFAQAVIAFETGGTRPGLNFYNRTSTGWLATPDWTVSARPASVAFSNDTGILLIRVTGPDSEQITYVGTAE